jgi:hypothetical protein
MSAPGPAHGPEPIDHVRLQPDQALAALVGLVLVADRAERERCGYRLEGGLGDGDLDHGRFRRVLMDTTLAASASPSRKAAHSSITGRRLSSMSERA